jgi:hypothetical protein
VTERERDAFRTGADFTDLCAVSRREWEEYESKKRAAMKTYAGRKKFLQESLRDGLMSLEDYATIIREEAQRHGV